MPRTVAHKHLWIAFLQPDTVEDPTFIIGLTEDHMWSQVEAEAEWHRTRYGGSPLQGETPADRATNYFGELDTPLLWWERVRFPQT